MLPVSADLERVLRQVVETLAPLDRTPCSPGERQAAEWLAARLGAIDGVEARLEDEPSWGTFPPTATVRPVAPAGGGFAAVSSFLIVEITS